MIANNPAEILLTLDRELDHEVPLVLYGRAALCLGFDNPPTALHATQDVDANHAHASRKAADLRNNAIRVGKLLSGLIASTRRRQIGKATGLILALVIPATYAFSHWLA